MKKFSSLSQQEKREIIVSRINSIFEIDKELLQTLITTENLEYGLTEIAPSLPAQEAIDTLINQSSSDLELMYLSTYKNSGGVKFGKLGDEYLINFEFDPFLTSLTNTSNTYTFNGYNGLSYVKHLKIVSDTNSIMSMPSLTIVIEQDGKTIKNQALCSFISPNQVNPRIVDIDLGVSEFQRLAISIVDNSNQHTYRLSLGLS